MDMQEEECVDDESDVDWENVEDNVESSDSDDENNTVTMRITLCLRIS